MGMKIYGDVHLIKYLIKICKYGTCINYWLVAIEIAASIFKHVGVYFSVGYRGNCLDGLHNIPR